MIEHICCDVDDVVADFGGAMCKHFGIEQSTVTSWSCHEACGVTEKEWRSWLNSRPIYFWEQLKVMPGAHAFIDFCQSIAPVTFTTAANFSPSCLYGRKVWMQEHFPNVKFAVIEEKSLLAQPGRVLIDDADKNVKAFREAGGEAITFPRPWNENRAKWKQPYPAAISELAMLGRSITATVVSVEYEKDSPYSLEMVCGKKVEVPMSGTITLRF